MGRLDAIAPAVKQAIPARVAIAGPAGSGKTFTALTAATVLAGGERFLVIDTERRSASLYADLFSFDALPWDPPYDPRELAETLRTLGGRYPVVVLDSGSHFWMGPGGTLELVDAAKAQSRSNNSFDAWRVGTPAQNGMVDAMLAMPCHVVFTMRSKTEFVQERDANNRTVIRKVGMAPIQRDGIEYEFTVTVDMDHDHNAAVSKTRCPALAGQVYPAGRTEEWVRRLADWLAEGEPEPERASDEDKAEVQSAIDALGDAEKDALRKVWKGARLPAPDHLLASQVEQAHELIEASRNTAGGEQKGDAERSGSEGAVTSTGEPEDRGGDDPAPSEDNRLLHAPPEPVDRKAEIGALREQLEAAK